MRVVHPPQIDSVVPDTVLLILLEGGCVSGEVVGTVVRIAGILADDHWECWRVRRSPAYWLRAWPVRSMAEAVPVIAHAHPLDDDSTAHLAIGFALVARCCLGLASWREPQGRYLHSSDLAHVRFSTVVLLWVGFESAADVQELDLLNPGG